MNNASLIICGDICPTKDTVDLFISGDADLLFNDVRHLFSQADYRIANLECALTDIGVGVRKTGPVLYAKRSAINVLKCAGFDALSLANNHIRDCGDEGVFSTMEVCQENQIATFGAGENEALAMAPHIVTIHGIRVGFLSYAEKEFNFVMPGRYGAWAFDVYDDYDRIKSVKSQVDYLVILYHGGIEHYPYPSPILQKKCRKMIESGANLVLCQHSHCIGTCEKWYDGEILYGQGNTIFGYRKGDNSWNQGMIVSVNINPEGSSVNYIPVCTQENGSIRSMEGDCRAKALDNFHKTSSRLKDAQFITQSWERFCDDRRALYLPLLYGHSRVINHLNRMINNNYIETFYSKHELNITMNLIQCDAHREVIDTLLNKYRY